jgi:hypothetical protein
MISDAPTDIILTLRMPKALSCLQPLSLVVKVAQDPSFPFGASWGHLTLANRVSWVRL